MENPSAYIPMDRRLALSAEKTLPDTMEGAALFADISGFTPLTEALVQELGPQRGAEELTRHLNRVFDALIAQLHHYQGSVITFSGDAITCWLNGDNGLRATACALAMQQSMSQFASVQITPARTVSLAMKAAVSVGRVRRFVVGDANIQLMDALAGSPLDQVAEAEHHAEKGEVVLSAEASTTLQNEIIFSDWRENAALNQRFGVVQSLKTAPPISPWESINATNLNNQTIKPWLLPPIFQRLHSGQGEFLAELRPGTALFLSFGGINFDQDEQAKQKLNDYMRWVQQILVRYQVYPLQLTIGDKGCYLYAAFGAPIAHEDDTIRAVSAALELQDLPPNLSYINQVKIGISQGRMWTGAYGGTTRRTYGIMGDDVNLAARLMQAAQPGETLVSQVAQQTAANSFRWEALAPITVKGKTAAINIYRPQPIKQRRTRHLLEPQYALAMVGRKAEMKQIKTILNEVIAGKGHIIGITGEAGLGKTRLIAEAVAEINKRNILGYAGECESYGTNTSYLVWQSVWQDFFNINPTAPPETHIHTLKEQLQAIDPALIPRLPLLSAPLNIPIPDNELTQTFDAKLRKSSLESLLIDCLRARALQTPILILLEDGQWFDPVSIDLLEAVGLAIADLPVLIMVAYRPPELQNLKPPWALTLPRFTEISLTEFSPAETTALVNLKMVQFFDAHVQVSQPLINQIANRAQGNPFYIEELLNYLHDRGLKPENLDAIQKLDFPANLHSLILSRIDQLSESQKTTLKVASAIGRLFRIAMLWGMYPDLGDTERVKTDLETLVQLELVSPEAPEPELAYFFKHIITQEVAYESLPFATRANLHEQLARYIEASYIDRLDQYIDFLAYHYERSDNEAKKREYLRKAGQAAQADYANDAAIDYYQRVLPLLPDDEKVDVMLNLGEVLQFAGKWDESRTLFDEALALAQTLNDQRALAWCQTAIAELLRKRGSYTEAETWLQKAQRKFETLKDQSGLAQTLHYQGILADQQGKYDIAISRYEAGLAIRRELDDKPQIARTLTNLGILARRQQRFDDCLALYQESLTIFWQLGDKRAIGSVLNNLGMLALDQNDYTKARQQLEEAAVLYREVGDRWATGIALHNLGNVARGQADYQAAKDLYEESCAIYQVLGDKWAIAYLLEDLGGMAALQTHYQRALTLVGAAEVIRTEIGSPLSAGELSKLNELLAPARQNLGQSEARKHLSSGREMSLERAIQFALEEG